MANSSSGDQRPGNAGLNASSLSADAYVDAGRPWRGGCPDGPGSTRAWTSPSRTATTRYLRSGNGPSTTGTAIGCKRLRYRLGSSHGCPRDRDERIAVDCRVLLDHDIVVIVVGGGTAGFPHRATQPSSSTSSNVDVDGP